MNQDGWKTFTQLCLASQNDVRLTELLDLILTQEEKESISMRCLIILELLKQDKTQRDIAESLQVSIAKITRGSNELKRTDKALIDFLKKELGI